LEASAEDLEVSGFPVSSGE